MWASDYPHADAVFPGVTKALERRLAPLPLDQRRAIAGGNARTLYGI